MLRFDVVHETIYAIDRSEPAAPLPPAEPLSVVDLAAYRYRTRNARVLACKQLPGFQGFSLRPEADVVIDGVHVALTPRLFTPHKPESR